jgi:hypothetical protein
MEHSKLLMFNRKYWEEGCTTSEEDAGGSVITVNIAILEID